MTFVTEKGGSSFRCGLDGAELAPCPHDYAMTGLAAGPHELRVQATDRFGLVEATPTVLRFSVDTTLPETIALVRIANDGDRRAVVAMGSDKAGRFQCALGDLLFELPSALDDIFWTSCDSGYVAQRGFVLQVRAVDEAGNKDPTPVRVRSPLWARAFRTGERDGDVRRRARRDRHQGPAAVRSHAVSVPHRRGAVDGLLVRLPPADPARWPPHDPGAPARRVKGTVMTTRELGMTVTPAKRDTTIAGLQMTLVLERRRSRDARRSCGWRSTARPSCASTSCAGASG